MVSCFNEVFKPRHSQFIQVDVIDSISLLHGDNVTDGLVNICSVNDIETDRAIILLLLEDAQ